MTHRAVGLALLGALAAAPAFGQEPNMKTDIRNLFHFGNCAQLICLDTSAGPHGTHYNPDAALSGTEMINFLENAITTSIGNIPIGGTSSGAVFSFDQNGVPIVSGGSTGPIFGERAQTLGRGHLVFGINATSESFASIRGVPLNNITLNLTHENVDPQNGGKLGNPAFEYDYITINTDMSLSMLAYSAYVTYGIANHVDLSVAVPVVHLTFNGTSIGTINKEAPGPADHYWAGTPLNPKLVDTTHSGGDVTGVGDMSVRLKANIFQSAHAGFGILADLRLPTGDADNLLGTGTISWRLLAIASARYSFVEPHVNVGYEYQNANTETGAALTTVGLDARLAPPITFAGEIIGRWEVGPNVPLPGPASYIDGSVVQRTTFPNQRDDNLDGSAGLKLGFGAGFTALGNVIFPIRDQGVKANIIWTAGLERSF
jgi:hypothetical protein